MTKSFTGNSTTGNIHKLRSRVATLEGTEGTGGGLTTDDIGDGLVLKDKKIEVSIGNGLVIDSGKINVELVHQPFVGGAASVSVNGEDRSAYYSESVLRSGSNWNFYTAKPLQISILNFGGVYKISLRGEISVQVGIPANNYNSLMWADILHYFGDATTSSLINTIGTSPLLRPYGPESQIWMPVTRRLNSTGNYDAINGEVHSLEAGTDYNKTYFMRFSQSLNQYDRVVLDSVFYWAQPVS